MSSFSARSSAFFFWYSALTCVELLVDRVQLLVSCSGALRSRRRAPRWSPAAPRSPTPAPRRWPAGSPWCRRARPAAPAYGSCESTARFTSHERGSCSPSTCSPSAGASAAGRGSTPASRPAIEIRMCVCAPCGSRRRLRRQRAAPVEAVDVDAVVGHAFRVLAHAIQRTGHDGAKIVAQHFEQVLVGRRPFTFSSDSTPP